MLDVASDPSKMKSLHLSEPDAILREKFMALDSFADICKLLEVSQRQLAYYTHAGQTYKTINLPKKHGGTRLILAPANSLKIIQRKLNQVLQAAYTPNAVVQGFVRGRSILSNAEKHSRSRYVLNFDLKDFFPSITFPRVRGLFLSKPYSLPADIATVLARICCYKGTLPQGAPTSPVVSNMLLGRFDSQMKVLARQHKCIYTRYADDITFSSFVKHFPKALATFLPDETGGSLQLGSTLVDLVNANGFSVNNKKTRLQHFSGRQEVTGLTVNRLPNVPQEFVRQVRAMLFAWQKFGPKAAADHFFAEYDFKHRAPVDKAKMYGLIVKGKIDYIGMVRGGDSRAHLALLSKYAVLNPKYKWPKTLPPRELDLGVLQEGLFAIETEARQGTAFRLQGVGLITCAHVVTGQKELAVKTHGGELGKPVSVKCIDEDVDLAILEFDNNSHASSPEFDASSATVAREDQIVLLGYPTVGPAVSYIIERGAVTGEYTRFGQRRYSISCDIVQGNSGGPVLDRNYRVIGVAANGKSRLAKKGDELYGVIPIASLDLLRSKCSPVR